MIEMWHNVSSEEAVMQIQERNAGDLKELRRRARKERYDTPRTYVFGIVLRPLALVTYSDRPGDR
jgi:hypothetical protein